LDGGNANEEKDEVDCPHGGEEDACRKEIGEEEGQPHDCRYGQQDAQFVHKCHAVSAVFHELYGLAVDPRRPQPALEAVRAARKAERGKQDEWDGWQHGEKYAEDAKPETDEAQRHKEKFFQEHR